MRPSRVACPSNARKVLIARAATPAPPVDRPPRPCAFFPRADLPAAMSACIASTSRSVRLLTRRGPSSGLMWVSIRLRSIAMLVAVCTEDASITNSMPLEQRAFGFQILQLEPIIAMLSWKEADHDRSSASVRRTVGRRP